jgi:hypothetical protein
MKTNAKVNETDFEILMKTMVKWQIGWTTAEHEWKYAETAWTIA